MQYIQFQPQISSDIPNPDLGSFNFYLDASDNSFRIKTVSGSTPSPSPYITGGTYAAGTITFTSNNGQNIYVTGITQQDIYITGGTYSAGTITLTNNNGQSFPVTGISQQDIYVTGGTYSAGTITFTSNNAQSFPVTGLTQQDTYLTGGTFNGSTGVLTLTDNLNQSIPISGLSNIEVVQAVETIAVSGTTSATTSVLIYGINLVTASTVTDFCTRLPLTPQKGKSVIVINTSDYIVRVFPSISGGSINGVVDGYFDVPNDGLPYTFICYINPSPGSWGTTSRAASNLSTITIPDMSISYTGGGTKYYVGTGTAIESGVGAGIDGNDNLTLTPASTYWRSEGVVASGTTLRIYTNILPDDVSGGTISIGAAGASKTGPNSYTSGTRGSVLVSDYCVYNPAIGKYCNTVVGGVLNNPVEIGDVGTMYFELPVGFSIGLGGVINQYSRFYYIFFMTLTSGITQKTYKFRFELDYV